MKDELLSIRKGPFPVTYRDTRGAVRIWREVRPDNGKERFRLAAEGMSSRLSRKTAKSWDAVGDMVERMLEEIGAGSLASRGFRREDVEALDKLRAMLPTGATIEDVARWYSANGGLCENARRTVAEAVEAFMESRNDRVNRHIETCRSIFSSLKAAMGGERMREVTPSDLDDYLSRWKNPRTRRNHRTMLVALWGFAKDKGIVPEDRRTAAERTEMPKVKAVDPDVMTPGDLRKLLDVLRDEDPRMALWAALGAFAGIRESERRRLTWDRVQDGYIALSSEITKTSRRRMVPVCPALKAWLDACVDPGAVYIVGLRSPHHRLREIRDLLKRRAEKSGGPEVKFPSMPQNGLRHSFVSYHYALNRDAALTASIAGHSVSVLESAYNGLVTKETAQQWFGTFPAATE